MGNKFISEIDKEEKSSLLRSLKCRAKNSIIRPVNELMISKPSKENNNDKAFLGFEK